MGRVFILVVAILGASVRFAVAQAIVQPASGKTVNAVPRSVNMAVFKVTNSSDSAQEIDPEVLLPEGWKLSFPLMPFELGAGEDDTIMVGFIVPEGALSGPYQVKCRVKDPVNAGSAAGWASVSVQVPLVLGINLHLVSAPQSILAGEDFKALFLVVNAGNAPQRARLATYSGKDFSVSPAGSDLLLKPGESRELALVVHSPRDLTQSTIHRLMVTVELTDHPDIKADARSEVEVIPLAPHGDIWHRLPVSLAATSAYSPTTSTTSLIGTYGETSFSNSLGLSGSGTLDENGKHSLAFSLAPPAFPRSTYDFMAGSYNLDYSHHIFAIHAGDRSYSASELGSGSVPGRGLEGDLLLGKLDFKAFYAGTGSMVTTQGTAPAGIFADSGTTTVPGTALGGSVRYRINQIESIGMSLYGGNQYPGNILIGGSGFLRPYDAVNLAFEADLGTIRGTDYAYSLQCDEREDNFSFMVKMQHASPSYQGAVHDLDFFSASGSLAATRDLSLQAGYGHELHNPGMDPALRSALLADNIWVGILWQPALGPRFTAQWKNGDYQELLGALPYKQNKQDTSLTMQWTREQLRTEASISLGSVTDFTRKTAFKSLTYAAKAEYMPSRELSFSGQLNYVDGLGSQTLLGTGTTLGLGGVYHPARNTTIRAAYSMLDLPHAFLLGYNRFSAGMDRDFGVAGSMTLAFQYNLNNDPNNPGGWSISASYRIPLQVPVSRKTSIGTVSGHVYDEETGLGAAGVIVSLDNAATVTDKKGNFRYPAVKTGKLALKVSTSRLKTPLTPKKNTPAEIEVRSRKVSTIQIALTQSCSVSGQIFHYDAKKNLATVTGLGKPELQKGKAVGYILCEISGPSETRRAMANERGEFRFDGLDPGAWNLKLYEKNLPDTFYFEKANFSFDLKPGKAGAVEVRVLQRTRDVQMIDEGELIESE